MVQAINAINIIINLSERHMKEPAPELVLIDTLS